MTKKTGYLYNSIIAFFCLISLFSGLVYRFYSLNRIGLLISLTLAIISFIIIQYIFYSANIKHSNPAPKIIKNKAIKTKFNYSNFLLLTAYLLTLILSFYILYNYRTVNPIISPWQMVPKYFWFIYALSSLLLIGNIINNQKYSLLLIIWHYFLSFSVALIVYRLGYGYDPFIHQATENLIAKTGSVDPRPFYYLGQYGLVVALHKITAISIVWLDKLLVPLSAAVLLPIAFYRVIARWSDDKKLNFLSILSFLSLTFPFLIVTTPQNLAYCLLIIVILLGLICDNFYDFFIIILISLTALIVHPVAGLPALFFALMLAVYHRDNKKYQYFFYFLISFGLVIILPALFFILDKNLSIDQAAAASGLRPELFKLSLPGQENFMLNFVYLYGDNLKLIFLLLALGGIIIAWKNRAQCRVVFLCLMASVSLFVSFFLINKIPFGFLISYERSDYPERVGLMAGLFLLPFAIILIYSLLEKISRRNIFIKLAWTAFLILILSASLYLSYPRLDNYFNSRGFSVSSADLKAVNWINGDADDNFIVLANQQVSAAALNQFGFKKYYLKNNSPVFYYPVPTGSPLYQYYLDMVYKEPSRETMLKAMGLADAATGYFVLNKYWWAFPKILAEAKLSSNGWQLIDDGEIYIFKYTK